jgi:hypothetical protein
LEPVACGKAASADNSTGQFALSSTDVTGKMIMQQIPTVGNERFGTATATE